ncbi:myosin-like coiled-coil protein-domain-containing protein [Ochromonadaceae sp. CCMP2298]|nr:myosin-like coiled-coil protein-domain-containing protein [Ochromonadaceae sp. CCMP2298]
MDANLQSLIYSRLANPKGQADSPADIIEATLQALTKKYSLYEVGPAELAAIDEKFQAALSSDQPNALEELFAAEERAMEASGQLAAKKALLYQSRMRDMDKAQADIFRLQEETRTESAQFKELEELCRNLQALSVEKLDSNQKLLTAETERTAEIDRECKASLSSVTIKIDAEEADIDKMEAENVDLLAKMEQFKAHLDLRREKLRNEKKTQGLMLKLEEAQLAQRNFHLEQEQLQRASCKSKIVHSKETILQLEKQLVMYSTKFGEFEDTLTRSAEVLLQLDERERSMTEIVSKLRADSLEWGQRAAQAQGNLITALEQQQGTEREIKGLQEALAKSEKNCRQLQARRKEALLREKKSAPAGGTSGTGGRLIPSIPFPLTGPEGGNKQLIGNAISSGTVPILSPTVKGPKGPVPTSSSTPSPSSSSVSSPARKSPTAAACESTGDEDCGQTS